MIEVGNIDDCDWFMKLGIEIPLGGKAKKCAVLATRLLQSVPWSQFFHGFTQAQIEDQDSWPME